MSVTVNPNLYAGKLDPTLYMAQIASAQDISLGLWHVREYFKDKLIFNPMDDSTPLQDASSCGLTPQGTTTIKNVVCELKHLGIYRQFCQDELVNTYFGGLMPQGVWNDQMPVEIVNKIVANITRKKALELQALRWIGDTNNANPALAFQDGILTQLRNLGAQPTTPNGYIQVTAAATIDATNVIAEMNKVINAMPVALITSQKLKLAVSPEIAQAYRQAVAASLPNATWGMNPANRTSSLSLGMFANQAIEVVIISSFAAVEGRTMVLANMSDDEEGNFLLATDALSDYSTFKEGFNQATIVQPKYEMGWMVRQGVAVKFPNQVVVYEP